METFYYLLLPQLRVTRTIVPLHPKMFVTTSVFVTGRELKVCEGWVSSIGVRIVLVFIKTLNLVQNKGNKLAARGHHTVLLCLFAARIHFLQYCVALYVEKWFPDIRKRVLLMSPVFGCNYRCE